MCFSRPGPGAGRLCCHSFTTNNGHGSRQGIFGPDEGGARRALRPAVDLYYGARSATGRFWSDKKKKKVNKNKKKKTNKKRKKKSKKKNKKNKTKNKKKKKKKNKKKKKKKKSHCRPWRVRRIGLLGAPLHSSVKQQTPARAMPSLLAALGTGQHIWAQRTWTRIYVGKKWTISCVVKCLRPLPTRRFFSRGGHKNLSLGKRPCS